MIAFDDIYRTELTDDQKAGDAAVRGRDRPDGHVVLGTQATGLEAGDLAPVAADVTGYAAGLLDADFTPGHVQVNADPTTASTAACR